MFMPKFGYIDYCPLLFYSLVTPWCRHVVDYV